MVEWWLQLFTRMEREGSYDYSNPYEKACARYVFGPLILGDIERSVRVWNGHKIRKQKLLKQKNKTRLFLNYSYTNIFSKYIKMPPK